MVKYQEKSEFNKKKVLWMGLSILALLAWTGIEVKSYLAGRPSFLGISYIGLFCGLLVWRYAVGYVYILTDDELIINSHFLAVTRTFTVPLYLIESYSDQYVSSLFKRTGISRFVHRYSSGDGRPTRMLVFAQQGKSHAVLFKVSDGFMKALKSNNLGQK